MCLPSNIQQITLPSGKYLYLGAIRFNEDGKSGVMKIKDEKGAPFYEEIFALDEEKVTVGKYFFPSDFLIKWLVDNNAIDLGTGQVQNIGYGEVEQS